MDKAIDDDVAWTRRRVVNVAFHDDVFAGLNIGFTTQAANREVREESLSVFSNGGMSSGHASEASTQGISEPYNRKPRTTLRIGRFDDLLIFIFEI